jgi:mRNA interferase MazF
MIKPPKYVKNYKSWHKLKSQIEKEGEEKYFHEQEIWWCSIGVNVGYEEDGKNTKFERPVLIFRKFNKGMYWGIPLTSKIKKGKFYFTFDFKERNSTVILSQLRVLSSKRLIRRMGKVNNDSFSEIESKVINLINASE